MILPLADHYIALLGLHVTVLPHSAQGIGCVSKLSLRDACLIRGDAVARVAARFGGIAGSISTQVGLYHSRTAEPQTASPSLVDSR